MEVEFHGHALINHKELIIYKNACWVQFKPLFYFHLRENMMNLFMATLCSVIPDAVT